MEIPEEYTSVIHASGNQLALRLGCDPIALGGAFMLCIILGYSFATFWGVVFSIALFMGLRILLVHMAEYDPMLIRVHYDSMLYKQGFWPAHPITKPRWRK
jgi:type IV secretory pathway TrbD component